MESVRADQLEIGDMLLNEDGTTDEEVLDVWVDDEDSQQTWLETPTSMGYLDSGQMFNIEQYARDL